MAGEPRTFLERRQSTNAHVNVVEHVLHLADRSGMWLCCWKKKKKRREREEEIVSDCSTDTTIAVGVAPEEEVSLAKAISVDMVSPLPPPKQSGSCTQFQIVGSRIPKSIPCVVVKMHRLFANLSSVHRAL
ncbi:hypothetical protein KCU65_g30, partial [Aureobasidium melanogenum]